MKEAGQDPAMQREQDDYLDQNYFQPALTHAKLVGLERPLSQSIVYDTHIQGGWNFCSQAVNQAVGKISEGTSEDKWISQYLEVRTEFLKKHTNPPTLYRPEAYAKIVASDNWALGLPLTFRGVTITPESFGGPRPDPIIPTAPIPDPEMDNLPLIRPLIPYTRGADVLTLQHLLNAFGMKNSEDQIYGPFTQTLVRAFQSSKGLKPDALVGPATWAALKGSAASTA